MIKSKGKTKEELLQEALVPVEEQPYKVPENWVWVKMGSLIQIIRGVSYKKHQEEFKSTNTNCLVVRGGNIQEGNIVNQSDNIYVDISLVKEQQVLRKGDVVLVSSTGSSKIIGKPAILKDNPHDNISFGAFLTALRPSSKVNSAYFGQYFLSSMYRNTIASEAKGSNINNIKQDHLNNLKFPLPPLHEQKRIADKVERLLNKINQAKQLIEEAKETFELRRAAILDKAFRGELTAKWRKENPNLIDGRDLYEKIKEERLNAFETNREAIEVKQMFEEFTFEELVDSNNWIYLKAKMFCFNISCGGTPSEHISESGEIPFLKVYNIVDNKVDFDYKPQFISKEISNSKLKKSVLNPKDVIMNIVGPPLKKIAIIPDDFPEWNMNQAIVRFRPIRSVLPEYVYYCLQFEDTLKEVINQTKGVVGQSNISVSQSRNLIMPIPSTEEQKEIVAILDCLLEKENQMLDYLRGLQKNLDVTEQSILSKAFKGELGTNSDSDGSAHDMFLSLGRV